MTGGREAAHGFVRQLTADDMSEAGFTQASFDLPQAWASAGHTLRDELFKRALHNELSLVGWRPSSDACWECVLVTQNCAEHHAMLLGALGAWHERSALAIVTDLQSRQLVLTAVPDQFPHPLGDLLALGFSQAERQTWCNYLLDTDFSGWENPDFRVLPWNPVWQEPALDLVVEAHENTLSGLILTWPEVPVAQHLRAVIQGLCAPGSALLPYASFVAIESDRNELLGAIWLELTASGPLLYELCVSPLARRRGVARALVGAAQFALQQAGHSEMLYSTLHNNAGVARLGVPHETRIVEREALLAWLSPQLALASNP